MSNLFSVRTFVAIITKNSHMNGFIHSLAGYYLTINQISSKQ